eukprot:SAG11_NODE_1670_length_4486_cov_6.844313_2_plen_287_part_00
MALSSNDRDFVSCSLADGIRVDGRRPFDTRELKTTCRLTDARGGHVEVQLGQTRVLAAVSAEAVEPFVDRPAEGFFHINVALSPMASASFESGRQATDIGTEVSRVVERGLRDSRAVDTESLCIVAGVRVWSLRVDVHVLDHGGNIIDCSALAVIAALLSFRRPDVTVTGEGQIVIHPVDERDPVPISINHVPICVSFGIFDGGLLAVDPGVKEELVMCGRLTITMNPHHEICGVHKAGGGKLSAREVTRCTHIAAVKVEQIHAKLQGSLAALETTRRNLGRPNKV